MTDTKIKFESIGDLADVAARLDGADKVPAYWHHGGQLKGNDGKHFTIVNRRTGNMALSVSRSYGVLEHATVYGMVANAAKKAKLEAHGTVETWDEGNTARVKLFFDNIKNLHDDGKGIQPGAQFTNPYGRKAAFKGSGYFVRLICTNGMVLKTIIPELRVREWHYEDVNIRVQAAINEWMMRMLSRCELVQSSITAAQKVRVTFPSLESRRATLEAVIGTPKHAEAVDKKLGDDLTVSKWDVYQGLTEYTSHADLTPKVRDDLEDISEKFLRPIYNMTPVAVVHV